MTKRNFSYFEAYLKIFLTQYHPLAADDIDFIQDRAKESEAVYRELISEGISCHAAYDVAMKTLIDGLNFSLYQVLYDLMSRDFKEIPLNNRRKVAIKLLPDCISVLKKYPAYEHDPKSFEMELTGIICAYQWEEDRKKTDI